MTTAIGDAGKVLARCNFEATAGGAIIKSSENIDMIVRNAIGDYTGTYINPVSEDPVVIPISNQVQNFLAVAPTTTTFRVRQRNGSGASVDPSYVGVTVTGN